MKKRKGGGRDQARKKGTWCLLTQTRSWNDQRSFSCLSSARKGSIRRGRIEGKKGEEKNQPILQKMTQCTTELWTGPSKCTLEKKREIIKKKKKKKKVADKMKGLETNFPIDLTSKTQEKFAL